jgi:hypothetical protein
MEVSISHNGGKSAMNCIMDSCVFIGMGRTQEVDTHQPFFLRQFVAKPNCTICWGGVVGAKWSIKIQIAINDGG